mmetsp:Transcript_33791/g.104329  ORF Transcript_33791/g.104329 Transcript_33791/m.104329 type:complete len:233 (-) Transcript_33791:72-770(-)
MRFVRRHMRSIAGCVRSTMAIAAAPSSSMALPSRLIDTMSRRRLRTFATSEPPSMDSLFPAKERTRSDSFFTSAGTSSAMWSSPSPKWSMDSSARTWFCDRVALRCCTIVCMSCGCFSSGLSIFSEHKAGCVVKARHNDSSARTEISQLPMSSDTMVLLPRSIVASAVPPASPIGFPRRLTPTTVMLSISASAIARHPSGPMSLCASEMNCTAVLRRSISAIASAPSSPMRL